MKKIKFKKGESFEGLALVEKLEKLGAFYKPKTNIDRLPFVARTVKEGITIILGDEIPESNMHKRIRAGHKI